VEIEELKLLVAVSTKRMPSKGEEKQEVVVPA